jgi:hypothetical protein
MFKILVLLLTTIHLGCSDSRGILKPSHNSSASASATKNTSKSGAEKDGSLIKEVGSEANTGTVDGVASQLQWAETTVTEPSASPDSQPPGQLEFSKPITVAQ